MIIRANKTLDQYLKELSCSEELYYEILKYNNIISNFYISFLNANFDLYSKVYSDTIVFNPILIYENKPYYSYKYNLISVPQSISSLKELTNMIERFLKLKAFM